MVPQRVVSGDWLAGWLVALTLMDGGWWVVMVGGEVIVIRVTLVVGDMDDSGKVVVVVRIVINVDKNCVSD